MAAPVWAQSQGGPDVTGLAGAADLVTFRVSRVRQGPVCDRSRRGHHLCPPMASAKFCDVAQQVVDDVNDTGIVKLKWFLSHCGRPIDADGP
jgi:hypothetical protein